MAIPRPASVLTLSRFWTSGSGEKAMGEILGSAAAGDGHKYFEYTGARVADAHQMTGELADGKK